ncbi:MAG TPA: cupredoxin domain-containing protein [Candidatus Dormibacteraeota bacterium]
MTSWVGIAGVGAAALLAACGGTNAPPLAAAATPTSSETDAPPQAATTSSTSSTTTTQAAATSSTSSRTVSSRATTSAVAPGSKPSPTRSTTTPCSPSGTVLKVSAQNIMFDVGCLAAPAGKAFTIDFNNQDSVSHNVSIYTADPMADRNARSLYQGQLIDGHMTVVYSVPALSAGTYYFNCVVHPQQMTGTFVVK